jgi:hypothetical protein
MLPVTALSIKLLGVQKWQTILGRLIPKSRTTLSSNSRVPSPAIPPTDLRIPEARLIARLVRAAANHGLYKANCLEQSLVLWSLLKRSGLESEIRFGARKEDGELQAHAWVHCLGVTLNEDRGVEERYSPFAGVEVPSSGAEVQRSVQSR